MFLFIVPCHPVCNPVWAGVFGGVYLPGHIYAQKIILLYNYYYDREFLEALEPTHVITVRDGKVRMEERSLCEADWEDPI